VASSRLSNRDGAYEDDEAYGYDEPEPANRVGIALLVAGSLLAGVLILLAIMYAGNFDGWRNIPAPPPPSAADAQLAAAAHRYLAIADPDNQKLNNEITAFTASERSDLAAASAALKAEVATSTQFDRQLAAVKFPAAVEAIAKDLIQANQARGRILARQARAKTLAAMQALDARSAAAGAAAEVQVKRMRVALHLPATSTG
jgi:hypothetical protein